MKAFALFTALLTGLLCFGAGAFIIGYVTIVDQTIPQLPSWAQGPVEEWMLDIPDQHHGVITQVHLVFLKDSPSLDLSKNGA
jgi:hypothetical protein